MAKDKEYQKLIHTSRWLKLRKAVLTAHPLCQDCEERGEITAATEVHHVRPVEEVLSHTERRQRMYDIHNLRALCHDCHVKRHTELGRCSKEAVKRRNEKQLKEIINKFF